MGLFGEDKVAQEILEKIRGLSKEVAELRGERDASLEAISLSDSIVSLRKQLNTLEIERDKEKEKHARQEREVEHKVGLEKLRFNQEKTQHKEEVELAKREAKLAVREEALDEDRKRFEKQMDFITQRFEKEVTYIQDILGQVLDRLPNVNVNGSTGSGKGAKEE